jgi:hypothetical protein
LNFSQPLWQDNLLSGQRGGTFQKRCATRYKQAGNKRGNDNFMKEKNGKAPWKYEIKRYVWIVKAH